MTITRWAPFSAFTSLEREMQDMLDRFALRPWSGEFAWRPTTDVYRQDGDTAAEWRRDGVRVGQGHAVARAPAAEGEIAFLMESQWQIPFGVGVVERGAKEGGPS